MDIVEVYAQNCRDICYKHQLISGIVVMLLLLMGKDVH